MKSAPATVALLSAALLAGCANNIAFRTGTPPPPGSSYQTSSVQAGFNSNRYFSLLFMGMFAAGVENSYVDEGPGPDLRAAPKLDENRTIVERDCSRPLAATSANLRCK